MPARRPYPAKSLVRSGQFERRLVEFERLTTHSDDGFYPLGDPSPQILRFIAAARKQAARPRYAAAYELYARAHELLWRWKHPEETARLARLVASRRATAGKKSKAVERAEKGQWLTIATTLRESEAGRRLRWNSFLVKAQAKIRESNQKSDPDLTGPSKGTLSTYLKGQGLK